MGLAEVSGTTSVSVNDINSIKHSSAETSNSNSLRQIFRIHSEWSTLIGRDLTRLVEPYYAGAKVYAITAHLKASKMPNTLCLSVCCYGMISGFNAQKGKERGHFVPEPLGVALICVFMAEKRAGVSICFI